MVGCGGLRGSGVKEGEMGEGRKVEKVEKGDQRRERREIQGG